MPSLKLTSASGRCYHGLLRIQCRSITTDYKFVDKVRMQVLGGRGGKGVVSFENVYNWKKRPIGGTGGKGGDVIIEASSTIRDLSLDTYVVRGRPGTDATGKGNNGRAGRAKRIMVPVGTVVKELRRTYVLAEDEVEERYDEDEVADDVDWDSLSRGHEHEHEHEHEQGAIASTGSYTRGKGEDAVPTSARLLDPAEQKVHGDRLRSVRSAGLDPLSVPSLGPSSERVRQGGQGAQGGQGIVRVSKAGLPYREETVVLADLDSAGQSVLVARGGSPGQGNRGSLLTYSQQRDAEVSPHIGGRVGEVRLLELELKSIADAGLVGFPNAGKSSLLAAVSRAKPKIADYPFTTLHPNVGVVTYRDGHGLSVADIPGLIEGAHADRGLGHAFLRHIERCPALVYVIDCSPGNPDPAGDLISLQSELRLYDPALPMRPSLVVANKVDTAGSAPRVASLRARTSLPVLPASARTGQGMDTVMASLRWLLDSVKRAQEQAEARAEQAVQEELHKQQVQAS